MSWSAEARTTTMLEDDDDFPIDHNPRGHRSILGEPGFADSNLTLDRTDKSQSTSSAISDNPFFQERRRVQDPMSSDSFSKPYASGSSLFGSRSAKPSWDGALANSSQDVRPPSETFDPYPPHTDPSRPPSLEFPETDASISEALRWSCGFSDEVLPPSDVTWKDSDDPVSPDTPVTSNAASSHHASPRSDSDNPFVAQPTPPQRRRNILSMFRFHTDVIRRRSTTKEPAPEHPQRHSRFPRWIAARSSEDLM
eukprot:c11521_g1_i1.p1 GENE.c11521_g1_i1~~c11521_g1_i1.p1  ORF type:complete len:265 (+),score=17.66 c11521_g1_i1:38-796(+)